MNTFACFLQSPSGHLSLTPQRRDLRQTREPVVESCRLCLMVVVPTERMRLAYSFKLPWGSRRCRSHRDVVTK